MIKTIKNWLNKEKNQKDDAWIFGSMLVGGIAGLLMPTPTLDNQDRDGNRANKGFGGAVTTVAQGNPVPILYGERDIGGFYASAGIYSEDDKG